MPASKRVPAFIKEGVFAQVGGNRSRDGGLTWWATIKYLAQSGGPVWWSSMVG